MGKVVDNKLKNRMCPYFFKEKILFIIIPSFVRILLWLLGLSMRLKEYGDFENSHYHKKNKNVIYALWHSRILLSIFFFRNKKANVLVSMNKDGEYIARTIHKFGFTTTRGSSSRGGLSTCYVKKCFEKRIRCCDNP